MHWSLVHFAFQSFLVKVDRNVHYLIDHQPYLGFRLSTEAHDAFHRCSSPVSRKFKKIKSIDSNSTSQTIFQLVPVQAHTHLVVPPQDAQKRREATEAKGKAYQDT